MSVAILTALLLMAAPPHPPTVRLAERLVTPDARALLPVALSSPVAARATASLLDGRRHVLARSPTVRLRAKRSRTVDLRLTAVGAQTLGRCTGAPLTLVAATRFGTARTRVRPARDPVRCAPLRWPPPPLSHPQLMELGSGFSDLHLQSKRDYVLRLPQGRKVGGAFIEGGHNVVLIGGEIALPSGTSSDQQRRGLYFKHQTGTVHVEGVLIDGSRGEGDGIAIDAPQAVVQVENVRIVGLRGSQSTTHADIVQPWGGVRQLRIDRLTGSSGFQGLQLPVAMGPIGAAYLRFVDLHALAPPGQQGGGHMLWLTNPGSCAGYTVALEQVYVAPRRGRTLGNSVWPGVGDSSACAAVKDGAAVRWPGLPVRGEVRAGSPPGGDFVPRGVVGPGYRTLGYVAAGAPAASRQDDPASTGSR